MTQGKTMIRSALLWCLLLIGSLAAMAARAEHEERPALRVQAVLEQARAAELGIGTGRNRSLAMALYCDAGTMGSADGFFHVGRLLATAPRAQRNPRLANTYLALAIRLGQQQALRYYDASVDNLLLADPCGGFADASQAAIFDVDAYLAQQPVERQRLAEQIRSAARQYNIDARLALAIALVESNLDAGAAVAGKRRGVMQLRPQLQQRAGVSQPLDSEQSIRAALSHLSALQRHFSNDWRLVAAAYADGRSGGDVPGAALPCLETRQYVRRVMLFAGFPSAVADSRIAGEVAQPARTLPVADS